MRRAGIRILSFAAVGLGGLAVDAGVLAVLLPSAGPWWGRTGSFVAAVFTTWVLNRQLTFRDRPSRYPLSVELGRYFAAMCIGGALNFAVYAGVIMLYGSTGPIPFVALAIGSAAGMAVNLTLAHYTVFRP